MPGREVKLSNDTQNVWSRHYKEFILKHLREAEAENQRLRDGIKALQNKCCGSDDLCNGCRALLGLLRKP